MTTVRLVSGPHSITVEDAEDDCGTVADLLALYREQLNIPADANVTVNGSAAGVDTPLKDGDEVAFSKQTGRKG